MPLTRANATPAEHITLPFYSVAYLVLGFLFLVQSPHRTQGAAFDTARAVSDFVPGLDGITVWGIVFLIVGLVEAAALIFQMHHRVYIWALIFGSGLAAFWAAALLVSAGTSHSVSFTSVVWVSFAPILQAASASQLARLSHPTLSAQ